MSVAATVMTPLQLAGLNPLASALLFPAATTMTAPAEVIALMAFWKDMLQVPDPPRLIFSTLAGLGLNGTPETDKPAAQRMPSTMSESYPPHLPKTRTGKIFEFQLIPVIPSELFPDAPIVPAV
jgi:hypothetical protein